MHLFTLFCCFDATAFINSIFCFIYVWVLNRIRRENLARKTHLAQGHSSGERSLPPALLPPVSWSNPAEEDEGGTAPAGHLSSLWCVAVARTPFPSLRHALHLWPEADCDSGLSLHSGWRPNYPDQSWSLVKPAQSVMTAGRNITGFYSEMLFGRCYLFSRGIRLLDVRLSSDRWRDSEHKSILAHTSKRICFHEASNMSLIE